MHCEDWIGQKRYAIEQSTLPSNERPKGLQILLFANVHRCYLYLCYQVEKLHEIVIVGVSETCSDFGDVESAPVNWIGRSERLQLLAILLQESVSNSLFHLT